jgi:hypothetical protein
MKQASTLSQLFLGAIAGLGCAGALAVFLTNLGDGFAAVVGSPVAAVLWLTLTSITFVRCVQSGRFFPLVLSVVFLAGIGFDLGMAKAMDAESSMVIQNLLPVLPWVGLGVAAMGTLLSFDGGPREA